MANHMTIIGAKFQWNLSTKGRDIASCVNRRTDNTLRPAGRQTRKHTPLIALVGSGSW